MNTHYQFGNVTIDLSYYGGTDHYSDGSIEDEMLNIAKNKLIDEQTLLQSDHRWPILYHFSSIRRNLLEWYSFESNGSLLEIGAGCGAMTGLFSEKVASVTAIELSKRRSEINANRHSDKNNIKIVVGNLNDIQLNQKFDYVTLIGVLEYAGKFTVGNDPYEGFLKQVRSYLKPGGTLIVAIENKFGLKYWAGAREDHTGRLFDGLENYPSSTGVRTFGKKELTDLFLKSGFEDLNYYYPLPDYKMPTEIYSDSYWPRIGEFEADSPNYDSSKLQVFNEKLTMNNLLQNGKFDFFANSYLVFCS